jgi:hypothetical protein
MWREEQATLAREVSTGWYACAETRDWGLNYTGLATCVNTEISVNEGCAELSANQAFIAINHSPSEKCPVTILFCDSQSGIEIYFSSTGSRPT